MKKTISAIIFILLLVAVFATPADASTGFALVNGVAEQKSEGQYFSEAFSDFWNNVRIDVGGASSFAAEAEGVAETENNGANIPYNGKIEGIFNPETGFIDGTYYLSEDFGDIDVCFKGSFTKYLETGENPVTLEFNKNEYGWKSPDGSCETGPVDLAFVVTFNVEGKIELVVFEALEITGAKFSNLYHEVEVDIPKGKDENGEYVYDHNNRKFATMDMEIPEGTLIYTAEDSEAIIAFKDMSTFVLKPECTIRVEKEQNKTQLEVLAGRIKVNIKKAFTGGTMEVETSMAVIGIKGTTFVLDVNNSSTTLQVIEGTVELTSKATGESVMVETGSMLSADSTGLGELQTFDTAAESASWPQVAAIDTGSTTSAAEPGEPNVVVLPYGAEAEELASDAAEEHASRIGWILGIYFLVAMVLVAAVVVIVLLTRRKKRI